MDHAAEARGVSGNAVASDAEVADKNVGESMSHRQVCRNLEELWGCCPFSKCPRNPIEITIRSSIRCRSPRLLIVGTTFVVRWPKNPASQNARYARRELKKGMSYSMERGAEEILNTNKELKR